MNDSATLADARPMMCRAALREPGATLPLGQYPYSPGRLVSLWDMVTFNALSFVELMDLMREFAAVVSLDGDDPPTGSDIEHANEFRAKIDKTSGRLMDRIESCCAQLQLAFAAEKVKRMRTMKHEDGRSIAQDIQELRQRIEDELRSHTFQYIPVERDKFFPGDPPPFSEEVRDKFPKLTTDIEHASKCLGCGLPTAAVCHLMRVMEGGIRHFAKRIGVPPANVYRKPWGDVVREIGNQINGLPYGTAREKDRRDRLSELAVYLKHVKDAWRNPTMHPERLYDQPEAEGIFEAVRAFMAQLAKGR